MESRSRLLSTSETTLSPAFRSHGGQTNQIASVLLCPVRRRLGQSSICSGHSSSVVAMCLVIRRAERRPFANRSEVDHENPFSGPKINESRFQRRPVTACYTLRREDKAQCLPQASPCRSFQGSALSDPASCYSTAITRRVSGVLIGYSPRFRGRAGDHRIKTT
jgi:hypothetical protein